MIGLEEVHDGGWNVIYYETLLGRVDERTRTITGAPSLKKDCERCPRTQCHLSSRLFILSQSVWSINYQNVAGEGKLPDKGACI